MTSTLKWRVIFLVFLVRKTNQHCSHKIHERTFTDSILSEEDREWVCHGKCFLVIIPEPVNVDLRDAHVPCLSVLLDEKIEGDAFGILDQSPCICFGSKYGFKMLMLLPQLQEIKQRFEVFQKYVQDVRVVF